MLLSPSTAADLGAPSFSAATSNSGAFELSSRGNPSSAKGGAEGSIAIPSRPGALGASKGGAEGSSSGLISSENSSKLER